MTWFDKLAKALEAKSKAPTKLTPTLRKHLEWQWDYGIAEDFAEDTIKDIARCISAGVSRGEDQTDDGLIEDFYDMRVTKTDDPYAAVQVNPEWKPEDPTDQELLCTLLTEHRKKLWGVK